MLDGRFNVLVATNGKDGIELAENELPDIILLDLFMPDMPGEDVAAALKENNATADIPILFVTALATNDDIVNHDENTLRKPTTPACAGAGCANDVNRRKRR